MEAIKTLIDAIRASAHNELKTHKLDDETLALVPAGFALARLDDQSDKLRRVSEAISIHRIGSFVDYWNRFSTADSVCFADLDRLSLTAVIDYHTAENEPHHCQHNATFKPRADIGWRFWTELSGRWLDQRSFQRVLEERLHDVFQPEPASLLDLIANLEATMKIEAKNVQRLDNGERRISYTKQNETVGNVTIPPWIQVAPPVFEGSQPAPVTVLLRWDVDEESNKAKFKLEIPDIKGLEQTAFAHMAAEAEKVIDKQFFWASQ